MSITIINKKSAPQGGRVLGYAEQKALEEKAQHLENVLERSEIKQGVNYDVKDEQLIKDNLIRTKKILQMQGAVRIGGEERRKLEKECREIQDRLRAGWEGVPAIPSWDQYQVHPKEGIRYANMRDTIVKWEQNPLRKRLVRRWKALKRMLYPDEASAANTMHLFPK